jgi:ribonuclease VapC
VIVCLAGRWVIAGLGCEVVPVTEQDAFAAVEAYAAWGRGGHSVGLNFGDCFAYVLARRLACPLLFVGDDFRRTDVTAAA